MGADLHREKGGIRCEDRRPLRSLVWEGDGKSTLTVVRTLRTAILLLVGAGLGGLGVAATCGGPGVATSEPIRSAYGYKLDAEGLALPRLSALAADVGFRSGEGGALIVDIVVFNQTGRRQRVLPITPDAYRLRFADAQGRPLPVLQARCHILGLDRSAFPVVDPGNALSSSFTITGFRSNEAVRSAGPVFCRVVSDRFYPLGTPNARPLRRGRFHIESPWRRVPQSTRGEWRFWPFR